MFVTVYMYFAKYKNIFWEISSHSLKSVKNIFFITKIWIKYNERRVARQAKWAWSARARELKRHKFTDSYKKYFGSSPACPLVPVVLCRKWPTFHSENTILWDSLTCYKYCHLWEPWKLFHVYISSYNVKKYMK